MRSEFSPLHMQPGAPEASAPLESPELPAELPAEPPARVGAEALEAAYRSKACGCVSHRVESVPEVCQ